MAKKTLRISGGNNINHYKQLEKNNKSWFSKIIEILRNWFSPQTNDQNNSTIGDTFTYKNKDSYLGGNKHTFRKKRRYYKKKETIKKETMKKETMKK
jgi:hypothetical protein